MNSRPTARRRRAGSASEGGSGSPGALLSRRWVGVLVVLVLCALPVFAQQTNLAVVVRHAPSLSGSAQVEGSLQQLLGESVTLNSGFILTGDLLVPGTLNVVSNGAPTFGGTIVGSGSASPPGYQVMLNANSSLLAGDFTEAGGSTANHIALWEFPEAPNRSVPLTGTFQDDGLPGAPLSLQWQKISGPGTATFANPSSAVTSVTFDQVGVYVLRLTATDSDLSALDELTIPVRGYQPPVVSAGVTQTVTLGAGALLNGSVTDDGLPTGGSLSYHWEVLQADGPVLFDDGNSLTPVVTFSNPPINYSLGIPAYYQLALVANDSELSATNTVDLWVSDPGFSFHLLDVQVSANQTITLPAEAILTNSPLRSLTITGFVEWQKVSGPGEVSFVGYDEVSAQFDKPGVYVLRVLVFDFDAVGSAITTVTVLPAANLAPLVNAGPARVVPLLSPVVALEGEVLDDGNPAPGLLTSEWTVLSAPNGAHVTFADASDPATTATLDLVGNYLLRLAATDSELSSESYVTLTVADTSVINQPPAVNAGVDFTLQLPDAAQLDGLADDDGLPLSGSYYFGFGFLWTQVSGPAPVNFADWAQLDTAVSFPAPGEYVLRLYATDGILENADDITVTVLQATNLPPFVHAGFAQVVSLAAGAALNGTVVDDGRPTSGTLSAQWSVVSGPGTVVFSEVQNTFPTAHAHAAFSQMGDYVLRLTSSDSDRSASADVTVTVSDIYGGNQPPVVFARPDASAVTLRPLALAGFATDDGLPSGTLLTTWSRSAGRSGGVRFDDASQTNTTATFSLPGAYTLRLSAQDGRLCDMCQLSR